MARKPTTKTAATTTTDAPATTDAAPARLPNGCAGDAKLLVTAAGSKYKPRSGTKHTTALQWANLQKAIRNGHTVQQIVNDCRDYKDADGNPTKHGICDAGYLNYALGRNWVKVADAS